MSTSPLSEIPGTALTEGEFAERVERFGATRRGARAARLIAVAQLARWGVPPESDAGQAAALIVAELAANAATHGRVPGRDFEVRLALSPGLLRIDVSDTRAERMPSAPRSPRQPAPLADGGRGLVLVDALATSWTVLARPPGKTVRAELALPPAGSSQLSAGPQAVGGGTAAASAECGSTSVR
ncbi:ATP-binding protein [Streptomyces sp. V4-01]|uniref:ATP-binding protein n=1 Tax=Actinacidiphila polyblastidii TaxID=3110430 RepID=A0ABU7PBZ4_9ACTN|nr:ATP-binding protein [Streptomyces sp. V4-01]